jgi:hypothetical protein
MPLLEGYLCTVLVCMYVPKVNIPYCACALRYIRVHPVQGLMHVHRVTSKHARTSRLHMRVTYVQVWKYLCPRYLALFVGVCFVFLYRVYLTQNKLTDPQQIHFI